MKILVTGASGFLGKHLVRSLLADRHEVISFVRPTSRMEELRKMDTEVVYGDIRDKGSIERALKIGRNVEVVFHLASVLTPVNVSDSLYWDVNYQGTQNLLEACRYAGLRALVHCSSVGVMGTLSEIPSRETSPCRADNVYGRSKYQAELLALEHAKKYDLPVSIVRPAWIYGPGDRRTYKLFHAIAKRIFLMIGTGETLVHPVYVEDVVQGLKLCAQNPAASGEVFIIAGAQSVTLNQLVDTIAEELSVKVPKLKIPVWFARFAASVCEKVFKWTHLQPPIHHRRLDFFLKDQSFDISKAREFLGFEPRVDLRTGIRTTLNWYKAQGWL
jgi:dihydroflavonol-4-reductase